MWHLIHLEIVIELSMVMQKAVFAVPFALLGVPVLFFRFQCLRLVLAKKLLDSVYLVNAATCSF